MLPFLSARVQIIPLCRHKAKPHRTPTTVPELEVDGDCPPPVSFVLKKSIYLTNLSKKPGMSSGASAESKNKRRTLLYSLRYIVQTFQPALPVFDVQFCMMGCQLTTNHYLQFLFYFPNGFSPPPTQGWCPYSCHSNTTRHSLHGAITGNQQRVLGTFKPSNQEMSIHQRVSVCFLSVGKGCSLSGKEQLARVPGLLSITITEETFCKPLLA